MPVIDLHQDLRLYIDRPDLYKENRSTPGFIPQTGFAELAQGNVRIVAATGFAVPDSHDYFDPSLFSMLENDFLWYRKYISEHPDWSLIEQAQDLQNALKPTGARGILLHIEGFNTFTGSTEDWRLLDTWKALGLRSIGMAWNLSNKLCGGTDDTSMGLTPVGHKLVRWLEDNDMVCDLAHMSHPAFFDVAKISTRPLLVSHGNADQVCPNLRNYTDEQLLAIAESDGVIGLFFSKKFLVGASTEAHIHDIVRHAEHIKNLIGVRHIAFGTDFGGIVSGTPTDLVSVAQLPALISGFRDAGWNENDIEAVAWKNAYRVLEAHLG